MRFVSVLLVLGSGAAGAQSISLTLAADVRCVTESSLEGRLRAAGLTLTATGALDVDVSLAGEGIRLRARRLRDGRVFVRAISTRRGCDGVELAAATLIREWATTGGPEEPSPPNGPSPVSRTADPRVIALRSSLEVDAGVVSGDEAPTPGDTGGFIDGSSRGELGASGSMRGDAGAGRFMDGAARSSGAPDSMRGDAGVGRSMDGAARSSRASDSMRGDAGAGRFIDGSELGASMGGDAGAGRFIDGSELGASMRGDAGAGRSIDGRALGASVGADGDAGKSIDGSALGASDSMRGDAGALGDARLPGDVGVPSNVALASPGVAVPDAASARRLQLRVGFGGGVSSLLGTQVVPSGAALVDLGVGWLGVALDLSLDADAVVPINFALITFNSQSLGLAGRARLELGRLSLDATVGLRGFRTTFLPIGFTTNPQTVLVSAGPFASFVGWLRVVGPLRAFVRAQAAVRLPTEVLVVLNGPLVVLEPVQLSVIAGLAIAWP